MKIQASEAPKTGRFLGSFMALLWWPGKRAASTSREYDNDRREDRTERSGVRSNALGLRKTLGVDVIFVRASVQPVAGSELCFS